jgi:peptide subunit release factor 1 (eRF1)
VLLLDEQFSGVSGVQCPDCGWLGPAGERRCPADGARLVALDDLTDAAIELSVQQSAELLAVRHDRETIEAHGGIGALLRF